MIRYRDGWWLISNDGMSLQKIGRSNPDHPGHCTYQTMCDRILAVYMLVMFCLGFGAMNVFLAIFGVYCAVFGLKVVFAILEIFWEWITGND